MSHEFSSDNVNGRSVTKNHRKFGTTVTLNLGTCHMVDKFNDATNGRDTLPIHIRHVLLGHDRKDPQYALLRRNFTLTESNTMEIVPRAERTISDAAERNCSEKEIPAIR